MPAQPPVHRECAKSVLSACAASLVEKFGELLAASVKRSLHPTTDDALLELSRSEIIFVMLLEALTNRKLQMTTQLLELIETFKVFPRITSSMGGKLDAEFDVPNEVFASALNFGTELKESGFFDVPDALLEFLAQLSKTGIENSGKVKEAEKCLPIVKEEVDSNCTLEIEDRDCETFSSVAVENSTLTLKNEEQNFNFDCEVSFSNEVEIPYYEVSSEEEEDTNGPFNRKKDYCILTTQHSKGSFNFDYEASTSNKRKAARNCSATDFKRSPTLEVNAWQVEEVADHGYTVPLHGYQKQKPRDSMLHDFVDADVLEKDASGSSSCPRAKRSRGRRTDSTEESSSQGASQKGRGQKRVFSNYHSPFSTTRTEIATPSPRKKVVRVPEKINSVTEELWRAVIRGDVTEVSAALEKGADVNNKRQVDGLGASSPLHCAAQWGLNLIVEVLLHAGAELEARTECGSTPLHCAAAEGKAEVVKQLIKEGANVNATTATGSTPLHKAALVANLAIAKALVEAGADVNMKNNMGWTPLRYATLNSTGHYLRSVGGSIHPE